MFRTILTGLVIFACASLVNAQSDDYKKFEFYAGYSHNLRDPIIDDGDLVPRWVHFNGFNTSITGNLSRHVGVKFDFSGYYKTTITPFGSIARGATINSQVYNYLGGIQVKNNSSEKVFKPFAHALVGVAQARSRVRISNEVCTAILPSLCRPDFTETETVFAGAFGGGLDIRLTNRIDLRVVQFDYNPTRFFDSTQHNTRVGIGVVFH